MKRKSPEKKLKTKTIVALASAGGALEMYDFVIYIFFASTLAKLFFPEESAYAGMLATLAIFAAGYLFRPIGGIVFGHLGDRYGRRTGLLITICLMAGAMMGMALMPTYDQAGIVAPILFCFFRLIQGVALGGDLPGAITFVNEYADDNHRGLLTGLLYCGVNIGLLMAAFVGMLFTNLLSIDDLQSWGWRFAFLFGISLFIIGFYFRIKNIETPLFNRLAQERLQAKIPLLDLFKKYRLNLCRSVAMIALHAVIIVQLFLYMPIYLERVVFVDAQQATIFNTVNIMIFSALIPLFGHLSDRYGRKIFFMIASVFFLILSYPLYRMINSDVQNLMLTALVCFAVLAAVLVSVVPVTLAELFPTAVRYSAIGITYNIGFGIFGGLSPIVSTFLIHYFHNPAALSVDLIVISLILIAFVMPMHFSKNQPLC
ncbi:MAG: hypothetical protein A3F13_06150 [Gammaproteobacteria bacterium RIFCSPHIGHO2_12_FULL_40_19]|nr:MAG: hypothetical protein A3F13_06150 [Gammaproteobacteria bacterium RIFCSPHIGHO2_12_FULL_40_19]